MIIETKALKSTMKVLSAVTGNGARQGLPILDYVAVEYDGGKTALFRALDLEAGVKVELPCSGAAFNGAIDAKALKKALYGHTVDFASDGAAFVTISADSGQVNRLLRRSVTDFPTMPSIDGPANFTPIAGVNAALAWVAQAMWTYDNGRPHLSQVALRGVDLVATDGHRLHLAKVDANLGGSLDFSAPSSAVKAAVAALEAMPGAPVEIADSRLALRVGNVTIEYCEVNGRFPPYQNVIPKTYGPTKIAFDATNDTIKLIKSMTSSYKIKVKGQPVETIECHMVVGVASDTDRVSLSCTNVEKETESNAGLTVHGVVGPEITIGVMAKYIAQALVKDERTIWHIDGRCDAMIVETPERKRFAIVMPVRL